MARMDIHWLVLLGLMVPTAVSPVNGQPVGWKGPGNFDYTKHLAKTPSQAAGLPDMPPGFEASLAHPNNFNPLVSGLDFLSDGRMVLLHSSYTDKGSIIYLVDGAAGPREQMKFTKIAGDILGSFGVEVLDNEIYYLAQDGIWKLVKKSGTPETWEQKFIAKYIVPGMEGGHNNGSRYPMFNLVHAKGSLYFGNGAYKNFNVPGRNEGYGLKLDLATGEQEILGRGLRMPNGMGANAAGDVFFTDNQGEYRPGSPVYHLVKGRHYGMAAPRGVTGNQGGTMTDMFPLPTDEPLYSPAIWVPFGSESRSLTNMLYLEHTAFQGQFLAGDNARGAVHRIQLEKVKGEYQGAYFQFSGVLEAGVQSLTTGPDGTIYGGALGRGTGGHSWLGRTAGLMKWKPTGGPLQSIKRVSSQRDGFDMEFTEALSAPAVAPENFWVLSYYYKPTPAYGGPPLDIRNHKITELQTSADRRTLAISVDGLEANRIYRIMLAPGIKTADGLPLFTLNAWYTLNQINEAGPLTTSMISPVRAVENFSKAIFQRRDGVLRIRVPDVGAYTLKLVDLRGILVSTVSGAGAGSHVLQLGTSSPLVAVLNTPSGIFSQIVPPEEL